MLNMLVSWVIGVKVNGIKSGEEEKKIMFVGLKILGLEEVIELMRSGGENEIRIFWLVVRLYG